MNPRPEWQYLRTYSLIEMEAAAGEVVNRDPSFGSSLLSDNFGQRVVPADDDALDPLKLSATDQDTALGASNADRAAISEMNETPHSTLEPLLQNPDGATQKFTHDIMQGSSTDSSQVVEEFEPGASGDVVLARTGLRKLPALTAGTQRLGNTDWGAGTDGGRSGKVEDGVPYGSFSGV